MESSQFLIKAILILVFVVAAIIIIVPRKSSRGLAIRRVGWLCGLLVASLAVLFPSLTDKVAHWVGVGRGADLVLYMALVFAIGYVLNASSNARKMQRELTVLARKHALLVTFVEENLVSRAELDSDDGDARSSQ
ncbi:DUF2304 domain-containing protein [Arcanobacterium pinnipediorum]|uniref:DUF2304 domain-containing protein n=1 Tax=Arcanobacterium pinnipediorum TaxID=1503041 RepID=A0ABY5AGY3_9ACTO|nr:DUF2304 domain-containing protein [Arcanobacterium pinnipediorum]USR79460.1 DUF2304 domain-containing protein [Arcanobacterium pinnipediorum]